MTVTEQRTAIRWFIGTAIIVALPTIGMIFQIGQWKASTDNLAEQVEGLASHEGRITVLETNNMSDRRIMLRLEDKLDRLLERSNLRGSAGGPPGAHQ